MIAMGASLPQVFATSKQITGEAYVNPDGLGQVLVFPYYTVRNGFKSFFNITNTSNETLALRVRFREGHNTRDALTFTLVLSAYDAWAAWIEDAPSGPVVKTTDNSCTMYIGMTGVKLSNVAYTDIYRVFEDQGDNSIERTREGYAEVITMGKAEKDTKEGQLMIYSAQHDNEGMPEDCLEVRNAFSAKAPTGFPVIFPFVDIAATNNEFNLVSGDGDPEARKAFIGLPPGENPLRGTFSIIDSKTGRGGGGAAVAIADFMSLNTAREQTRSLITAQNFPYFLEPSLASRDGIWTTSGLADVEKAIASSSIVNEWANNPATGAEVDWVVTFPTKGFHVDHEDDEGVTIEDNIHALNNQWRKGFADLRSSVFLPNTDQNGAAVDVFVKAYDREDTVDNTASVSKLALLGGVNLVSFDTSPLSGQNFVSVFNVDTALGPNVPNGWAELGFITGTKIPAVPPPRHGTIGSSGVSGVGADGMQGLPVLGFAFKSRNQGDPAKNYSQVFNHSWK